MEAADGSAHRNSNSGNLPVNKVAPEPAMEEQHVVKEAPDAQEHHVVPAPAPAAAVGHEGQQHHVGHLKRVMTMGSHSAVRITFKGAFIIYIVGFRSGPSSRHCSVLGEPQSVTCWQLRVWLRQACPILSRTSRPRRTSTCSKMSAVILSPARWLPW